MIFERLTDLINETNDYCTETTDGSGLDLDAIRRLYGSGLAMRLATERKMAQNVGGRLMGHGMNNGGAKNVMYEAVTGDDMTIQFGDYLNLEQNRPIVGLEGNDSNVGVHTAMERKFGL